MLAEILEDHQAEILALAVIIEVEDECGGIHPDILKNLFKPFASGGPRNLAQSLANCHRHFPLPLTMSK